MHTCPVITLLLAIVALPPITAQAQELRSQPRSSANADQSGEVFAGVDYQQGDYGAGAKVETISTSVGIAVRMKRANC